MTRISKFATAFGLAALKTRQDAEPDPAVCHAYGMDFQSNGQYFQNSLSNDNFTFVEQFEGCNPDVAYNIIVDPQGEQNLCTETNLTPDDADMLSTCPLRKNQLVSGDWSIIVISNNGDGVPLAAQRDFLLSVGPQSTSTVTPTITATRVINPIVNQTITTTTTGTTFLNPSTLTVPSATITPTTTVIPSRVTSSSTKAFLTIKVTAYTFDITKVTSTKTASCKLPTRSAAFDPRAVIIPTVGPVAVANIIASLGLFRREADKARFLQDRASRLALAARAPDPQPLLVTETNTNKWTTSTVTSTGSPIVATITSEVTSLATLTPPAVTVLSGEQTALQVTITAPTPTLTKTVYVVATVGTTTKTVDYMFTIRVTTTPSAVAEACTSAGGILG
ncbi:uncharacterized protein N0V89_000162 [Didymosphaeria variabile]|uniref:Uncharacterized protein n=1 Tax=Didymosphaeria variabile TaxID=1932322 RepID=A0A9W8XW98_9PLEO|nr:uncharacterized protein N0V89_000162 [Didymosphaeria variabile]KAJ4359607.1 hypothetical protein N0V89_000162 [Didymosphaeria variabile]